MHIVKSVGVMAAAKISGAIYGCLGLLFAPFFLLFGLIGSIAGQNKNPFAGVVGIVLAVLMPIFYGAMGFIMGALGAFLYNLLAGWLGGFEIELEAQPNRVVASYPIVPPPTPSI